ncbi:MAG TPA: oligopeptidase A, partial [Chromatiales bacterium]|nr:oligopeptidase A [Chromatiales bacterium]
MENPLLATDGLPAFSRVRPEHVEPAVDAVLAENRARLAEVVRAAAGAPAWEAVGEPLERMEERLGRVWSVVRHLHAVRDSEPLRAAYNACLPRLSDYHTELAQNEDLYAAYRALAEAPAFARLDAARRRAVELALRDFRLAGVELPAAEKARYREIARERTELEARFEQNLLDATQAWKRHVTDPAALAGLPETALAMARQAAEREGLEGWLLNLELPLYLAVMCHARDRALRREAYEAYVTRASDRGPFAGRWDNGPLMERILALRHEQARLLGFASYADYALATRMARSVDEVRAFLEELARHAVPAARRELAELEGYARARDGLERLEAWDVAYYAERLREERFGLSEEDLRPYFPVERVLEGLFALTERLFGVRVRPREGVDVWHPDVRFYELVD